MNRIMKALLYTCKDYAIPSRNNELEEDPREIFEGITHQIFFRALKTFAECPERCALILKLENGQEIVLLPTLQSGSLALSESNRASKSSASWDLSVEVISKTLTFGQLKVGQRFIGMPIPGDDNGHGGFKGEHYIFRKISNDVSEVEYTIPHGSAVKEQNNVPSHFPHSMEVIVVE